MSNQSSNLGLPFLASGQAQKHVTVNESLLRLDALVQTTVVSATTTAEPASPSDGQIYLLPAGKTGAHWAAMANGALAYYRDGVWEEIVLKEGFGVYIADRDFVMAYNGAAWRWIGGHLGCLVKKSANQTIANSTHTALTFDVESRDVGALHATTSNTSRLVVPPGAARVSVRANAAFAANATGARSLRILKNGASFEGIAFIRMLNTGAGLAAVINVASGVLDVAPGDYFEASAYQDSGGNLDVLADDATWFEMEVVG